MKLRFSLFADAAYKEEKGQAALLGPSVTPAKSFVQAFLQETAKVGETMIAGFNPLSRDRDRAVLYAYNNGGRGKSVEAAEKKLAEDMRETSVGEKERENMRSIMGQLSRMEGSVQIYPPKMGEFFSYREGDALFQPARKNVPDSVAYISNEDAQRMNLPGGGDFIARASDLEPVDRKHGEHFKANGFESALDMVRYILEDVQAIYKAGGNAYHFMRDLGDIKNKKGTFVAEFEVLKEGNNYRITTVSPYRPTYFKNKTPIWEKAPSSRSEEPLAHISGQNGVYGGIIRQNGGNVNTLYQFIGEYGAERLDRYDRSLQMLDRLAVARSMEKNGESPERIKLAVGWERGADGLWRYEIDDSEAELRKNGDANLLSDILHHPSLFKAYPMMARVPVTFEDIGNYSAQTRFDTLSNGKLRVRKIVIDYDTYKSASDKRILSLLMHEVQHAIQATEGFAMGGSQRTMDVPRAMHHAKMHKQMLNLEEEISSIPNGKNILFAYDSGDMDAMEEFPVEDVTRVDNIIKRMADVEKRMQRHRNMSDFEAYQAVSGEVEARNVEKRLEMSAKEREASLASATEDVAREDQIIIREGLYAFSDNTLYQRAWHGTPHNFDAFTLAHIGSGEGAQAHGWGLYQAMNGRNGNSISVSSNELGVPEGSDIREYRRAAREVYRELQKTLAYREDLGEIRFSGDRFRKMQQAGADKRKWQLVPRLKELIESAEYISKNELYKARRDDIVAFHWLEADVDLDGEKLRIGINIGEDSQGNKFYNINHDIEAFKAKKREEAPAGHLANNRGPQTELPQGASAPVESRIPASEDGVNLHILEEGGRMEAPRASVTFSPEDGKAVVEFFKNADATSLPHEMFHIFRREQL